jgi:glycosyltransferase involved in cell wall biosynthesis
LRMQSRLLSPLTHIPWEQITLPLAKGDATLINLCNIGPAFVRNAVTMVHDAQVHLTPDSYSPAFRLWYKAVQGSFARRNRLLLTVSDYSRNQLVDAGLGSPDRIAVVHNGVDHAKATPADPAIIDRLGLNASPFTVALASTQAHKNIRVLLEAYARPALADTSLVLFGSEGPEAFAAAGMRVPQNVVFAGRISDGELRALLENAIALLFPSTTEGFGLPPAEAMVLGCPTIVAPCGALPEICGTASLYAEPDDPEAWVRCIATLHADLPLREHHRQAGYDQSASFTWRKSAVELLRILNTLAADPKGLAIALKRS